MKRDKAIFIRLTESEAECLTKLSMKSGQSRSAWIRTEIVARFAREFPTLKSQRASNKIGNRKTEND